MNKKKHILPKPTPIPFKSWRDFLCENETRSGKHLASIANFVTFCRSHMHIAKEQEQIVASSGADGDDKMIPNLLQGGKATGPISKTDVPGQIVRAAGYYSGLTAKPKHKYDDFFRHDDLNWIPQLHKHIQTIQEELLQELPNVPEDAWTVLRTRRGENWSYETGWSHIAFIDNFSMNQENINRFPETFDRICDCACVKRRLGPRLVAIARQKSGTGIEEHVDFMNWMLTMQMTIHHGPVDDGNGEEKEEIEGGCGIVVNGETLYWSKKDMPIVIDTTFRHSTFNDSKHDVYLLLVDFWHPDLSLDEIDALRCFFAVNSGV